jgi:hypothetical protein
MRAEDGRLLCPGCHPTGKGGEGRPIGFHGSLQTVAHDSGDGATVYHCPMCGGGQVTGRSDGTIECDFCDTAFTVQVQPTKPSQPQTNPLTGEPLQMPGMPGERGGEPTGDQGGQTTSEGAPVPSGPPGDINAEFEVLLGEGGDEDGDDSNIPPQFKQSFLLGEDGIPRDVETFVRHLAVLHADDKSAVLKILRDENRGASSRRQ